MKKWIATSVAGALVVSGLGLGFGSVVSADHDNKQAKVVQTSKKNEVRISLTLAKQIAKQVYNGGKIDEIELEKKNGRLVYHVEFENRKDKEDEIYIDADTGSVTFEKDFKLNDDDDDNDDDDRDDNDDDNDDQDGDRDGYDDNDDQDDDNDDNDDDDNDDSDDDQDDDNDDDGDED
ncbi:PepSY domain-containing protein [Paenibacillus arenosi]|uniref:PepSY domain-containing protein n=1 Tax=Paenibacillus arenosi TaxID=2774142 RepID=A0ABR9AYL6_9BACL|nr:PepSY domain-containing protein [Paenibacillus arenosi]MBD8498292.1 PepSY domain-containing protein [Paenibacillus arenosi]